MVIMLFAEALASPLPPPTAAWPEAGLKWIKNYRTSGNPAAVPELVRTLSKHGAFKDPETSGIYVGFLAGVLGSNPTTARSLIAKILPLPFEDQWIVIRAVAFSGLPDWQEVMREVAVRLPNRQVMAERYLTGALPTLNQVPLEPHQRTTMEKVMGFFKGEMFFSKKTPVRPAVTFESNPDLIDVLWGLYFATGKDAPISAIIRLLPWSKERDSVKKLTVGSMAKFTLAANASRDVTLLATLRRVSPYQPKSVRPILDEVVEAAETADAGRIGKEALAAVEELKSKGPGSLRELAWWGQLGELSLSLGCVGLAVTGQAEAGIPCVVGGALSTAALRYLARPE